MRVLVVGSGAREHALVARFVEELDARDVLCTPGNPGIAGLVRTIPSDPSKLDDLLAIAAREEVTFTVIGPELPLSLGVADRFNDAGYLLFGPTAAAAQLESSKAFAKAFMARHLVPTARFRTCDTREDALDTVRGREFGFPVVLKADGLASGKGVVIAAGLAEAEEAVNGAMSEGRFGAAGSRLVVEECLTGQEVSFFAICDGARALSIGTAQDHKRIFDGDRGPNTGGMGAFAPSPLLDESLHDVVMSTIVTPVVKGMAREGHPFTGFLYVGLMLTPEGPKVIEFNVRLGDPEAQVILPLISEPLLPLLAAAAEGKLAQSSCRLTDEKLVGVVLASRGYPESSESDRTIAGVDDAEQSGAMVRHAGTALRHGELVTAGGRVLTVVGRGDDYGKAMERAYEGVRHIRFDGMQFRRDIGQKALQHHN